MTLRSIAWALSLAILIEASSLAAQANGEAPATESSPPEPTEATEPSAEAQAEYRTTVERAVGEFDAGRWAEARALFLRAHELWPSARTLRTLGMTSFELRAYVRALEELQAALDESRRPLDDQQRSEVAELIDRARAFVGRYRLELSPPEATLLVDGIPRTVEPGSVLLLSIGEHELLARAPEHGELRRRVIVQGREDETIVLTLRSTTPVQVAAPPPIHEAPTSKPSSASHSESVSASSEGSGHVWTWVAAGATVALAASSTALWLVSDDKYDEEFDRCHEDGPDEPATCAKGEADDSWEDLQTAHYVTLGLAIAAGAGTVALFFLEGSESEAPTTVSFGPGSVTLRSRY